MAAGWFERVLSSIVERGKAWIQVPANLPPLARACELARLLTSGKGEASGAALASALMHAYGTLDAADRREFLIYLAREFAPDEAGLRQAAEAYLARPGALTAAALREAAEPPRQELLRLWNLAADGTRSIVGMRQDVLALLPTEDVLKPLESDLRHLLASWFNRGFLDLRRIDWHTPASILEKLILHEAVHEINGWTDLRRRLAEDRRCFAFFHPALPDDPLIFVEVALVRGLASAIEPLLRAPVAGVAGQPDTAIFYSISNCQPGLRGISFGNFLIKQVVEDLKAEIPSLVRFATLSPVPGLRRWLARRPDAVSAEMADDLAAFESDPNGRAGSALDEQLQLTLRRLCAEFLTAPNGVKGPDDSVARFHLRNGARLERINARGNTGPKGMLESYGVMVNYLYDPQFIEANHERFVRQGEVAASPEVAALARNDDSANGPRDARRRLGGSRR